MFIKSHGPGQRTPIPIEAYYYNIDAFRYLTDEIAQAITTDSGKTVNEFIYKYGVLPFEPSNLANLSNSGSHQLALPGTLTSLTLPNTDGSTPLIWSYPLTTSFVPYTCTWTI